jgi:hypothetical protein
MSLKRIPSTGDLLAVWNDRSGRFKLPKPAENTHERTPLVSAISSDEGRSWRRHRLIERDSRMGFCYTAIHFTPSTSLRAMSLSNGASSSRNGNDGHALLAYCAGGRRPGYILSNLRVRRIPVRAFYR